MTVYEQSGASVQISDMTIYGGGDAKAKELLAEALKANAEAIKTLALRMSEQNTGIKIEGDTHNHYYDTTAPDTDEEE